MDWPEKTIALLERILLENRTPSVRVIAIQSLAKIGCYYPINLQLLYNIANKDVDPEVSIAAIVAITDLLVLSLTPATMSNPPTVQMNFNAPVYGAAGTVAGDQIVNVSAQDFDALLQDYKQFFNDLQQKYPTQTPEAALLPIIDAEFQELQTTQPQRWQNFLKLQRLWNGGKKATLKMGEHFTEENLWGKMAIAFLEGVLDHKDSE